MTLPAHLAAARIADQQRRRALKIAANNFEDVTRLRLIGLGFVNVEKVATPLARNRRTGSYYHTAKVSGDIKAMDPRTGQAVLVECKLYPGGLPFKALKRHQVVRLDECARNHGLALLALSSGGQFHLLVWGKLRAAGFGRGTSVTPAMIAACTYTRAR